MGPIKEPKHVDLSTRSEPWTEEELVDFRRVMQQLKTKSKPKKKVAPPLQSTPQIASK